VLLVWHKVIDLDYLSQFPNLRGIVRYGVGFDNIDFDAVNLRELFFCNTPDYGIDEVSDTAIAMIMNISRGITRYDFFCRNYNGNSWQENTNDSLRRSSQLTIGIIGAGRIGGSIIRKAKAIGFIVLFYDPYKDSGYEKMLGADRADSIDKLLKVSDIVSLNAPLTNETKGLVDKLFISKMKHGASLVNTARGGILADVDDFIEPIKSGAISGLALDVLPNEPPEDKGLISAWKRREEWLDGKVIINPHSSYYSIESYEDMRSKAALNAKRILDGKTPLNIVIK